jgi:hypothetical protein
VWRRLQHSVEQKLSLYRDSEAELAALRVRIGLKYSCVDACSFATILTRAARSRATAMRNRQSH